MVKKNHTLIGTLEIEKTCIIRQLEYFKLQLKYLENITHNMLNLKTLDALMRVLFVGLKVVQWIGLPSSTFGETCENEGYLRLIDRFF